MIAVTGANGFVGARLLEMLSEAGRPFSAAPRPCQAKDFEGAKAVVHLAGLTHGDGQALEEANVAYAAHVAAAARDAGVARFVHVSSGGVYGSRRGGQPFNEEDRTNPGTPYEVSKLRGEAATQRVLERAGGAWTILRPSGVFGPGRQATRTFFAEVQARRVWIHGPACAVMNPVFVDDLVQAILLAIAAPGAYGRIFNIGGADALRFDQLIAEVARALGRAPPLQVVLQPRSLNRSLDIANAREALGYQPRALETGLRSTAAQIAGEDGAARHKRPIRADDH
jgi:UDP-glucose 4-epimerase